MISGKKNEARISFRPPGSSMGKVGKSIAYIKSRMVSLEFSKIVAI